MWQHEYDHLQGVLFSDRVVCVVLITYVAWSMHECTLHYCVYNRDATITTAPYTTCTPLQPQEKARFMVPQRSFRSQSTWAENWPSPGSRKTKEGFLGDEMWQKCIYIHSPYSFNNWKSATWYVHTILNIKMNLDTEHFVHAHCMRLFHIKNMHWIQSLASARLLSCNASFCKYMISMYMLHCIYMVAHSTEILIHIN